MGSRFARVTPMSVANEKKESFIVYVEQIRCLKHQKEDWRGDWRVFDRSVIETKSYSLKNQERRPSEQDALFKKWKPGETQETR